MCWVCVLGHLLSSAGPYEPGPSILKSKLSPLPLAVSCIHLPNSEHKQVSGSFDLPQYFNVVSCTIYHNKSQESNLIKEPVNRT